MKHVKHNKVNKHAHYNPHHLFLWAAWVILTRKSQMNCTSSTSDPMEQCHLVQNHRVWSSGPVSSEREEVEFPLINGSGGFNLSMAVPTEVHHSKVDVYVRVSRCWHTEKHAILMMNISECDIKLWRPSENTAHSPAHASVRRAATKVTQTLCALLPKEN